MQVRIRVAALIAAVALLAGGCSMHGGLNPPEIRGEGIITGHAALTGIRPYDGRILDGSLLSEGIYGDVVSLEIWPIGSVGVGIVGARLKLLVLDAGLGVILYKPKPAPYPLFSGSSGGKEEESPAPAASSGEQNKTAEE